MNNEHIKAKKVLFFLLFLPIVGLSANSSAQAVEEKRWILFDPAGIVPSLESWKEAVIEVLHNKYNIAFDPSDYSQVSSGELFLRVENALPEKKSDVIADLAIVFFKKLSNVQEPISGVIQMLEELKKSYHIGLISHNPQMYDTILTKLNIRRYFSKIFKTGYGDMTIENGFLLSHTFGKNLKSIISSYEDRGAKKPIVIFQTVDYAYLLETLDIPCIGGTWGLHSKQCFEKYLPNYVCAHSLEELPSIIKLKEASL